MARILERVGCRVQYNPAQTCCGQPALNAGFFNEARLVADKFLNDFNSDTAHFIVAPSASCVGMVRNTYPMLYKRDPECAMAKTHQRLKPRIFELSEFLVQVLKVDKIPGAHYPGKVAFHDSCSGLRECRIGPEPRKLLSNVQGLELLELNDNEICCGFGGTFAIKFESISIGMAEQKVENALATGADTIVSTDSSCLMQLEGYIKKHNIPLKTAHLADILVSGWDG
jgi:L-lactate dehydrogenase complex protein LldE